MLYFEKKVEFMGFEKRIRKDGTGSYTIVTILSDNGKTLDLKYDGVDRDFTQLKVRQAYTFVFKFNQTPKFSFLNVMEIKA